MLVFLNCVRKKINLQMYDNIFLSLDDTKNVKKFTLLPYALVDTISKLCRLRSYRKTLTLKLFCRPFSHLCHHIRRGIPEVVILLLSGKCLS